MPRASSCLFALAGLIGNCSMGNASTNSFSGSFVFDDDVQFFKYRSSPAGTFSVNTFVFPQNGSAPALALYNLAGTRLFTGEVAVDGQCGDTGGAGYCYDSALSQNAIAVVKPADLSQP